MKPEDVVKRQDSEQAVMPAQLPPFVQRTVEDAEKARNQAVNEIEEKAKKKKQLYSELCVSDAWAELKSDIRKIADAVTKNLTPAKGGAMDLQEVGMKYIIASQIASALEDIISIVEINKKEAEIPGDDNPVEEVK